MSANVPTSRFHQNDVYILGPPQADCEISGQTRHRLEHAMAVLLNSLDLGPIRIELAKRPLCDVAKHQTMKGMKEGKFKGEFLHEACTHHTIPLDYFLCRLIF